MRDLFRAALALGALALAMIGCHRSGSTDSSEDSARQALEEAPYRAAFRVPGMT
jgi:hypothetical protein